MIFPLFPSTMSFSCWIFCLVHVFCASPIFLSTSFFHSEWHPPSACNITSATCNDCQVLVAVGRDLYYLEVRPNELVQVRSEHNFFAEKSTFSPWIFNPCGFTLKATLIRFSEYTVKILLWHLLLPHTFTFLTLPAVSKWDTTSDD